MAEAELGGTLGHQTHPVVEAAVQQSRGVVRTLSLQEVVEVRVVALAVSMAMVVRVVARLVLLPEMLLRQTVGVVHKPQAVLLDQALPRLESPAPSIRAAMVQQVLSRVLR
jgi:hypothetical protein